MSRAEARGLNIAGNAAIEHAGDLTLAAVHVGRRRFCWWVIDTATGTVWTDTDLRCGEAPAPIPDNDVMVGTLISFLTADIERYTGSGAMGTSEPSEPYSFPTSLVEAAYQVSDELQMLSLEIEERHQR